jgi:hypothetical protein
MSLSVPGVFRTSKMPQSESAIESKNLRVADDADWLMQTQK